jgi:predicted RecB family nuclease
MGRTLTSEIVIAYSQCVRKAFLLLCTEEKGTSHEYVQILQQRRDAIQNRYIETLKDKGFDVKSYSISDFLRGSNFLVGATLEAGGFAVQCGILTRVEKKSALGDYSYEPTIFAGAYLINNEHKLELSFIGYVLNLFQGIYPNAGKIVGLDGVSHKFALENNANIINQSLQPLKDWISLTPSEPAVILNKHCSLCEFKEACYRQAKHLDHLSLLKGISEKK